MRLVKALRKLVRYWGSRGLSESSAVRLVLAYPESEQDWVLGGICRHVSNHTKIQVKVQSGLENLPIAEACFLAHYSMLTEYLTRYSDGPDRRLLVYYTHPREIGVSKEQLVSDFNVYVHKVITMNSCHRAYLLSLGVHPEKVEVIIGGADMATFVPRSNPGSTPATVGFCVGFRNSSHYRERKDFDRLVEAIKRLFRFKVLLVGHGWREYERFEELVRLPWFEYVEGSYCDYPSLYGRMDVFVSLSRLEGGPIPVIEALSCDLPVVATATGMCPDVIHDGVNGFLLPIDVAVEEVVSAIDAALLLEGDFRASMVEYSWSCFADRLTRTAGLA